ncbi:hypothetical protein AVEN_246135-1 [Araneus ventricosus]|uniref:Tc1-like transposase DDE domain-containing protein n=1 Tax=Araneus ventricosus TaxID=182803 RepID=A0A4Y2F2Z5_ARAVE|nr:hypothetical protein AVEN_246135-1 [Araneus ventricosus]
MNDNARPHRSWLVDSFLFDEEIFQMAYPAHSPDMKPIEHAWDILGIRFASGLFRSWAALSYRSEVGQLSSTGVQLESSLLQECSGKALFYRRTCLRHSREKVCWSLIPQLESSLLQE